MRSRAALLLVTCALAGAFFAARTPWPVGAAQDPYDPCTQVEGNSKHLYDLNKNLTSDISVARCAYPVGNYADFNWPTPEPGSLYFAINLIIRSYGEFVAEPFEDTRLANCEGFLVTPDYVSYDSDPFDGDDVITPVDLGNTFPMHQNQIVNLWLAYEVSQDATIAHIYYFLHHSGTGDWQLLDLNENDGPLAAGEGAPARLGFASSATANRIVDRAAATGDGAPTEVRGASIPSAALRACRSN